MFTTPKTTIWQIFSSKYKHIFVLFKCAFLHVRAPMRARANVQLSIKICLKHSGLTYPKFIAYLASPFESYLAIRILLAQNLPIASISIGGLYLNFSPWRRPILIFWRKIEERSWIYLSEYHSKFEIWSRESLQNCN